MTSPDRRSRITGCLLGGAVGDALGAPVEFMELDEIRQRFGPAGIADMSGGQVTDDTQMTIFTVEALIRAHNRFIGKGTVNTALVAHRAYLRWLTTQDGTTPAYDDTFAMGLSSQRGGDDGGEWAKSWLLAIPALHMRRAPGSTCLSALRSGRCGTRDRPINNSKGCGGLMRIAPVGLAVDPDRAFGMGTDLAAITHGHPTGHLAAGFFAAVVSFVVRGTDLPEAIDSAILLLCERAQHEETLVAIQAAVSAARSDAAPSPEVLESLGRGWVAEEALAMTLYCALAARSFRDAVLLAVNHSGDSDSTGSLVGSLLGAHRGREVIPQDWLEHLELRELIEELAYDLYRHFGGNYIPIGEKAPIRGFSRVDGTALLTVEHDFADFEKYPGY